MRRDDILRLSKPYPNERVDVDRRFHSAIGADVPHASELVREIYSDLDEVLLGVRWWTSTPIEHRALISDYLYQCAYGIELNLAEAKLHHMEFLDAREKHNDRIANAIYRAPDGSLGIKMPRSLAPIDDLPSKLEGMHVCGFFQSIGSTLDCLGAVIIGVLGLPSNLRKADIAKAEKLLDRLQPTGTPGNTLQLEFKSFFELVTESSDVTDWLEWADQYRNMFVHRGRRSTFNHLVPREGLVLDRNGAPIPRITSTMHLAQAPDKSDAEGMMHKRMLLNEDADVTLTGIFKSCRDMEEALCERLLAIWEERRANPFLIEQPASQWDADIRLCSFTGYDPNAEPVESDVIIGHPVLRHRMVSAGTDDSHTQMWLSSPWDK